MGAVDSRGGDICWLSLGGDIFGDMFCSRGGDIPGAILGGDMPDAGGEVGVPAFLYSVLDNFFFRRMGTEDGGALKASMKPALS